MDEKQICHKDGKDFKNIAGILIGYKYRCPYKEGWFRPDYVDEKKDYVIFYHNPGWIGNWHWMTTIDNFKKNFFLEPQKLISGKIEGVEYVSLIKGYENPEIIKGKKVFSK